VERRFRTFRAPRRKMGNPRVPAVQLTPVQKQMGATVPDDSHYERRLEQMVRRTMEMVRRSEELLSTTLALVRRSQQLPSSPITYATENVQTWTPVPLNPQPRIVQSLSRWDEPRRR
jgi:hypothetical protein